MITTRRHRLVAAGALGLVLCMAARVGAAQSVTLDAPPETSVGGELAVGFSGDSSSNDFITIVAPDTAEGRYTAYAYARDNPAVLTAPSTPGEYEIRYLGAQSPYPTLARRALTVVDASATLTAPASVGAGAAFDVTWTGPDNPQDFVSIVPAGAPEGEYATGYQYTGRGPTLSFTAPDEPGSYEIRYLMGSAPYRTLGTVPLTVTGTAAALAGPAEVMAGASVTIEWQGPNNARDYITIVAAGAPDGEYEDYVYTERGNPVTLAAPESAGRYEIRYLTGQTRATLASAPLTVTPASASVDGPREAAARSAITVRWQGPGNELDYVAILPASEDNSGNGPYAYVRRGAELRVATPDAPGEYEIRYVTGREQNTLAAAPLTVIPSPVPGRLRVVDERVTGVGAGTVVAVVLDASGSMLQRIDGERRIDIAKDAVETLVSSVLPETVQFTLRVFGHREADSCRTDLEIPIGPLDRAASAAVVGGIEAMNLARTPIARSLELVGESLAGRAGPHLVILVTDGEETCDGDPARVIESLRASGLDVRVNIVGLAIDELMLRETFAEWARLGEGRYFDAQSARDLELGLAEAVRVPYELRDAADRVVTTGVVNGEPVAAPAGAYRVRVLTQPAPVVREADVTADRETVVTLE